MWDTNGAKINISLIRHGKTYANEQKLYYGFSDIELSESGIEELNMLKRNLKYKSGKLFITSGLKRTIQTLNILFGKIENVSIFSTSLQFLPPTSVLIDKKLLFKLELLYIRLILPLKNIG